MIKKNLTNALKIVFISFIFSFLNSSYGHAQFDRSEIRIVGSSTVYPFTASAAEIFHLKTGFKTPIIESNGTGGGIHQFCQGVGASFPDITNASRPITEKEIDICKQHQISDIIEIEIGIDAIILAQDINRPTLSVTTYDLWLALTKYVFKDGHLILNPYKTWHEVNPNLPNVAIKVYGPSATSGTRDSFISTVMVRNCGLLNKSVPLPTEEKNFYCRLLREDEHFIDAGENKNLIIRKLQLNKEAIGIIDYSHYIYYKPTLQSLVINNKLPDIQTIQEGSYPISRKLYLYVKQAHLIHTSGLIDFVKEYISDSTIGLDGILVDKGLIPLKEIDRLNQQKKIEKIISSVVAQKKENRQ